MLLKNFLDYCRKKDVIVYVQEGQCNPITHNEENQNVNEEVRRKMRDLIAKYSNVTYLTKSELYEFKIDDYLDIAHVIPEAGKKYTQSLLSYLPNNLQAGSGDLRSAEN